MFKKIDTNSDGSISKDEFTKSHEALKARFTSHFHHKKPEAKSDDKPGEKKPEPKKDDKKPEPKKRPDDKKPEPKKSDDKKPEKKKGDDKAEAPAPQEPAVTESSPAKSDAPGEDSPVQDTIAVPASDKVGAFSPNKLWELASRVTTGAMLDIGHEARPLVLVGQQFAAAWSSSAEGTLVAQLPDAPSTE